MNIFFKECRACVVKGSWWIKWLFSFQKLKKYLDMSLLHGRVTNKTYKDILDRVDTRLLGCNTKHLSFTKKLTLAQVVIQALPIYLMQTIKILRATQEKIDRICRCFIWSGNSERNNMSMVSSDSICQPKSKVVLD